ncbi:MAG: hypothetical protein KAI47_19430 [Deltaproteobacteria bacterium]|nr:hypothetical protein [Deltaproteobacteria bacterium]
MTTRTGHAPSPTSTRRVPGLVRTLAIACALATLTTSHAACRHPKATVDASIKDGTNDSADGHPGDLISDALAAQIATEVEAYLTAETEDPSFLQKLDGVYAGVPFAVFADAVRARPPKPVLPAAGVHEDSWQNPITARTQTYSLYVPTGVAEAAQTGTKDRFPLIVFLHGAGGNGAAIAADPTIRQAADNEGALLVAPTDDATICDWSETEDCMSQVVNLVQLIKRRYAIDDRRVVLTGFSMGGRGSFSVGVAYPEPYCGITPVAGTIGAVFDDPDLQLHKRYCCPHLQNADAVRLRYFSGDQDGQLMLYQNRGCALCLTESSAEHEYVEVAGQGHVFFATRWRAAVAWALQKPRENFPKTVHRNLSAQASGINPGGIFLHEKNKVPQYWAEPTGRKDTAKNGHLAAQVAGQDVTVATKNVTGVTLYLSDDLVDLDLPIHVVVDSKVVHDGKVPRDAHVLLRQARLRSERAMIFAAKIDIPL